MPSSGEDVCEIRTFQMHLDIGIAEGERVADRALQGDEGRAEIHPKIDRIGLAGIAEHGDRAALEGELERTVFQRALGLELYRGVAAGRFARRDVDIPIELQLPRSVDEGDLALGDLQLADEGRFGTVVRPYCSNGRRGNRIFLEGPVAGPVGTLFQCHRRVLDTDEGQHNMAAEQRPGLDGEGNGVRGEHPLRFAPFGIGERDFFEVDNRGPAPIHVDRSDTDAAAGRLAGPALGLLQEVGGVQQRINADGGNHHQRHQGSDHP